jgi:hypothetical protein
MILMRARGTNALSPTSSLTERQALIWLDEQLFPGAGYNDLVLTARIAGALDVPRLARAWRQCVDGLDAFQVQIDRTQPRQSWRAEAPPPLAVVRLDGTDQLAAWTAARLGAPLWSGRDTWDAALLALPDEQHVLFVRAHQIVADRASLLHLLDALAAWYGGQPPAERPGLREHLALRSAYAESDEQRRDRAPSPRCASTAGRTRAARRCSTATEPPSRPQPSSNWVG